MFEAGIRFDRNIHLEVKLDLDNGQCDVIVTLNNEGAEQVITGSVVWDE